MSGKKSKLIKEQNDVALQNYNKGEEAVAKHPMFIPLLREARIWRNEYGDYPQNGYATVSSDGYIYVNPHLRAEPEVWTYVLAHCLLHLGMEHLEKRDVDQRLWNIACDCVIAKFLAELKLGKRPPELPELVAGITDEERLYRHIAENGVGSFGNYGVAGPTCDMIMNDKRRNFYRSNTPWSKLFALGLSDAVKKSVSVVRGEYGSLLEQEKWVSVAVSVRDWFVSSYPLLGAIAANFKIIEDPLVCQRMQISIAAVSAEMQEIYINPHALLTENQCRFVMAHEFLHVALRHDARVKWRDPYLWNIACDYVINDWLTDMGVGERPDGLLYDPELKGLNAENIYDRIVTDLRKYRKLATLRGVGLGDVLLPKSTLSEGYVSLDDFYRRALMQGLDYHCEQGRGFLPAGLVEEIKALAVPPIGWDVALARWFDERFVPLEKRRTYARASRRQSSTPNIPRPSWYVPLELAEGRTYGVILDTSGSMDRRILGKALGAIASYSLSRDVNFVRVVFCDAEPYDEGYINVEDISGRVQVKGRGGTVLQPAIDLLINDKNFPAEAPILVITDGFIDKVIFYGRTHAFLVPEGARLPFVPKGEVFRIDNK